MNLMPISPLPDRDAARRGTKRWQPASLSRQGHASRAVPSEALVSAAMFIAMVSDLTALEPVRIRI
jgi:hypothetical protein